MGIFITFEGPEGSGKTTIAKMIFEYLNNKYESAILTREPGGIEIAEQIRKIILDKDNIAMDKRTEALLYAAARRQHLVEKVFPALNENKIVLSDRYIDSSLAYQGYARNIDLDEIMNINNFAMEGAMPDLTILFDIDPSVGMERINCDNNREKNRLDLEKIKFHTIVREGYLLLAEKFSDRIKKVDASKGIREVFENCINIINEYLERNYNV